MRQVPATANYYRQIITLFILIVVDELGVWVLLPVLAPLITQTSSILLGGQTTKECLLSQHFASIKNNQPSILFGLASFAEGLDLPGNACNHLILLSFP